MKTASKKDLDVVNKLQPVHWANEVKECSVIAGKFYKELDVLLHRYFTTGEIQPVKLRLHTAVKYFAHRLHKNLIEPVTAYYEEIAYFSGAKKHQRDTLDFINSLWNFMDGMTKSELDGELIYQGAPLNRPEKLDKAVRRKKKSSRESTYEITLSLHEKDMSIEEIASLRQLTENTIYGHFIHLYKKGKVDITSLLDKEKLADLLPHFTNVSEETSLTEIKSRLPFTATYNEIRAAKAYYLEKN